MNKTTSLGSIGIDLPLDTIQAIRLLGALLESDFDIHVAPSAEPILAHLSGYFDLAYKIGFNGVRMFPGLSMAHNEPQCQIGDLTRPLVFPHHVANRCRVLWRPNRTLKFAFCGLVTPRRKRTIDTWIQAAFPDTGTGARSPKSPREKVRRLLGSVGIRSEEKRIFPEIGMCLFSSDRGRLFPNKAWDEEYANLLADSEFVLCPDGDFIWTYRFFEAILCGSIPIVESHCPLYAGFEYFLMTDPLECLHWSAELVERNFNRAVQALTIPVNELNMQLERML